MQSPESDTDSFRILGLFQNGNLDRLLEGLRTRAAALYPSSRLRSSSGWIKPNERTDSFTHSGGYQWNIAIPLLAVCPIVAPSDQDRMDIMQETSAVAAADEGRAAHDGLAGALAFLVPGLLSLAILVDGLDTKVLAYATPLVLKEFAMSKTAFGPVLAAAAVGMVVGTPIGGWTGDRFGRKRSIVVSLLLFGLTTMLLAFVRTPLEMGILRFVSGLGFGSLTPPVFALMTELVRSRGRAFATGLLTMGFPSGAMLGAAFMLGMLSITGWRESFAVAGLLTLLLGFVIWKVVPESPEFRKESVIRHPQTEDAMSSAGKEGIFGPTYLWTSLSCAFAYVFIQFVSYCVTNWGAVVFTDAGYPLALGITAGFVYNFLAIGTTFAVALLMRRATVRTTILLCGTFTVAAIAAFSLLMLDQTDTASVPHQILLVATFGLIGAGTGAMFQVFNFLSTIAYPAHLRSTGVGFIASGGRVGGIIALMGGASCLIWARMTPAFSSSRWAALPQ
ncbi:MFS transporter [Novosphingobium sp. MW5]|nr:MFS transporter [Novosphingobium sp. MW5]